MGVDGAVESNSYSSLIKHDIGNNADFGPLYRNPAASITAGYFDLLNKNNVVSGTFKHHRTYQIDGLRSATAADIYVTLTVYVQQCFFGDPGNGVCSVISSDGRTWGPGDTMPSSAILTVEAARIITSIRNCCSRSRCRIRFRPAISTVPRSSPPPATLTPILSPSRLWRISPIRPP